MSLTGDFERIALSYLMGSSAFDQFLFDFVARI